MDDHGRTAMMQWMTFILVTVILFNTTKKENWWTKKSNSTTSKKAMSHFLWFWLSCQHDGNKILIVSIMYILCRIYLSIGNMMPYNKFHDCAQLYCTILIFVPPLWVWAMYYLLWASWIHTVHICFNYGPKNPSWNSHETGKLLSNKTVLKRWKTYDDGQLSLTTNCRDSIPNYITFPEHERCSTGAKLKNDGKQMETLYRLYVTRICHYSLNLRTMERRW